MIKKNEWSVSNRIAAIVGIIFAFSSIAMIFSLNYWMKKDALDEARTQARIIIDQNLAVHTYFSKRLKPPLLKLLDAEIKNGYFEPSWMSSTFAIGEINKYSDIFSGNNYYYKECAINARSSENEADAYEREFIEKLNIDPDLIENTSVRTVDGHPYFVVLRRGETMLSSCLRCHSTEDAAPVGLLKYYSENRSFGRHENEVVSAISIRVPLEIPFAHANTISRNHSIFLVLILTALYAVQLWLQKRLLFWPMRYISEKAQQIADDPDKLGQKIQISGGRELHELASTFNAMSLSLKQIIEVLQSKSSELLAKNSELQESEEKYRTLIANIRAAVLVHDKDTRILSSNSMAQQLLGLTEDQMLGKEATDLDWHLLRENGTKMPVDEYPVNLVLSSRQPLRDYLVKIFRPEINGLSWLLVHADPVFDDSTALKLIIVTFMDLSEQKKIETSLRENEEELRILNEELEQRVCERTKELESKNVELAKVNKIFVGRELRMVELKKRISDLEMKIMEGSDVV
nr:DUF3365 domain-containing protein [Desulfobulbaceae bacterium]